MSRAALPLTGVPVRHVTVPQGRLAVAQVSARGPRAPIVLVPGYTGSKEDFGAILAPLADTGRSVFAYDQRGQHESIGNSDSYTPQALASDLLALLQALELPRVHLLGHSFGGFVARAAVLAAPGRFTSLTLMDSGPAALPDPRAADMRRLRPVLLEQGLEAVWKVLEAAATGSDFGRERFLAQHPPAVVAMGDALLSEPDRTVELSTVAARHALPLLVLTGQYDDAWSPPEQHSMAIRLNARYVEIPGATHSPAIEAPVPTVAALRAFYDNIDGGVDAAERTRHRAVPCMVEPSAQGTRP